MAIFAAFHGHVLGMPPTNDNLTRHLLPKKWKACNNRWWPIMGVSYCNGHPTMPNSSRVTKHDSNRGKLTQLLGKPTMSIHFHSFPTVFLWKNMAMFRTTSCLKSTAGCHPLGVSIHVHSFPMVFLGGHLFPCLASSLVHQGATPWWTSAPPHHVHPCLSWRAPGAASGAGLNGDNGAGGLDGAMGWSTSNGKPVIDWCF